jgi:hypothetical protein
MSSGCVSAGFRSVGVAPPLSRLRLVVRRSPCAPQSRSASTTILSRSCLGLSRWVREVAFACAGQSFLHVSPRSEAVRFSHTITWKLRRRRAKHPRPSTRPKPMIFICAEQVLSPSLSSTRYSAPSGGGQSISRLNFSHARAGVVRWDLCAWSLRGIGDRGSRASMRANRERSRLARVDGRKRLPAARCRLPEAELV